MITHLGNLLRAAYASDRSVLVPLGREVEWLRGYAAMMAERFRGQLAFHIQVEVGLEQLPVPRMLLQPIVENALRHGLREGRGWLEVDVRRVAGRLQYKVSDDGVGLPDSPSPGSGGTGLANVARRLDLLFPGEHSFQIAGRSPHGVEVTMSFPVAA
jgi:two-component system, LytTR family, sensor kinase